MTALPRLCDAVLPALRGRAILPDYDRAAIGTGVVHLGPGAFHRAHQGACLDDLLAIDPRWGVCAVSLHSAGVRDALIPQDGLYTLMTQGAGGGLRVIGALREILVAPENPEAVLARLAAPATRLVTLTITEKGYGLDEAGALDLDHPGVRHDREQPRSPVTAIGYLVEALRRRRAAGIAPPTIVSCDNLADNGQKLRGACIALAAERDLDLSRWIAGEVRFPRTMVDSITPETDEALRARVRAALGVEDSWPVQRETFLSWVIEDDLGPDAPDFFSAGALVVADIAAHAAAKLRLLNGAHSALAYLGLAMGKRTVAGAMADRFLAGFVEDMMRIEIAPALDAPGGMDVDAYIGAILERFCNPAVSHDLDQIAWDGSQKLPIRVLATIRDNLASGRPVDRLTTAIAAWMRFVRRRAREGARIIDPDAARLSDAGAACSDDPVLDTDLFLGRAGVITPDLAQDDRFRTALQTAYAMVMRLEGAPVAPAALRYS